MYSLAKPFLFKADAEKAHDLTMSTMSFASKHKWALNKLESLFAAKVPYLPVKCMGLDFKHPVGLAAGLDKDARALSAFSALGFSGVELGTVTPQPQPGNEQPRMFRLPENEAIINRMGFNSVGVEQFIQNLETTNNQSVVGINIGKNAATAIEDAKYDYVSALQRVYPHADYITINISSPNTKSLRDLQNSDFLDDLLLQIKQAQLKCQHVHDRYVPIALKVAPDLDSDEIETIAELLIAHDFDALIASNTTVSRPNLTQEEHIDESGGLSGAPVKELSTQCIKEFYTHLKGKVPIIGVGGILTADDAWEKLLAGADYLQVYSGLVFNGPEMVADIVMGIQYKMNQQGYTDVESAMLQLRE